MESNQPTITEEVQSSAKLAYHTPVLKTYGTISELTLAGQGEAVDGPSSYGSETPDPS